MKHGKPLVLHMMPRRLFLLSVLTILPVGLSLKVSLEAFPSPRT